MNFKEPARYIPELDCFIWSSTAKFFEFDLNFYLLIFALRKKIQESLKRPHVVFSAMVLYVFVSFKFVKKKKLQLIYLNRTKELIQSFFKILFKLDFLTVYLIKIKPQANFRYISASRFKFFKFCENNFKTFNFQKKIQLSRKFYDIII